MLEVDAVEHADRARRHEVAADHPHLAVGHGRVRQALRERRLDVEADFARGFLGTLERGTVGDAHAVGEARLQPLELELRLHLRARAVDDHQANAHRVQQRQVVHQGVETAGFDQLAAEADDERPAAMRMHVGCDVAQPGDELRVGRFDDRGRQRGFGVVHARKSILTTTVSLRIRER